MLCASGGVKALVNQAKIPPPRVRVDEPVTVAVGERIPLWNRILPALEFGIQASWKI